MKNDIFPLEANYFEFLSGLIEYEGRSEQEFLDRLLGDAVQLTSSKTGYLYRYRTANRSFECISSFGTGSGEYELTESQIVTENTSHLILKKTGYQKLPVLENDFAARFSGIVSPEFQPMIPGRICLLPLSIGGELQTVLALVNRKWDYDAREALTLQTLLGLAFKIAGWYRITVDLRDKEAKAVADEKLKNQFMISVSHDIKTPVNAIVGFSNLLAEQGQSPEVRKKYLDIILRSSEELLTLTRDFSEISNLSENLRRTVKKEVNITKLLNEFAELYSARTRGKEIAFSVRTELKEDENIIITDPGKLNQVLSCIVGNAFRFTFSGEIILSCRKDKGFAEFSVSDTGIGISEKARKNIFRYFSPGEDILLKKSEGAGIGLAISYAYIRHLGGDIRFESTEGEGTVFHFTLPFVQGSSAAGTRAEGGSAVKKDVKKDKLVLVAEDDDNNFFLIENILQKEGCKVIHARNGQEAVTLAKAKKPELVLMDIKMPEMDGYTATRLILESQPGLRIIAQTAYPADRDYAIALGCVDFIAKPFSKQQLLSVVSSYI